MSRKRRVDQLLVERGLAASRTEAQRLVMAGLVRVGEERARKPSQLVPETAALAIIERLPYVSRGGFKLAHALDAFGFSPKGCVCLDVGASTGGFTDVLLQRGARKVYALDVGYGQLHEKLRRDARVVNLERTHLRMLSEGIVPESVDAFVVDVSFISATRALQHAWPLLKPGGWAVVLIKPQFELAPRFVPKGVVRDTQARARAIEKVRAYALQLPGCAVLGVEPSPILGPKGNQEFLLGLVRRLGA